MGSGSGGGAASGACCLDVERVSNGIVETRDVLCRDGEVLLCGNEIIFSLEVHDMGQQEVPKCTTARLSQRKHSLRVAHLRPQAAAASEMGSSLDAWMLLPSWSEDQQPLNYWPSPNTPKPMTPELSVYV